ncbi:uncharacterized protein LOC144951822 isoform X2 [Lampetra fluviatilis]
MATDERFKKKTEQLRILLDDLKKLSRFDSSTVPTLQRINVLRDPYNKEEWQALVRTFHKEGGVEHYMKMLTSLSPDASNVPDHLQRPMEWSTRNVLGYVTWFSDPKTTFVDCGGLKYLLGLLKHHACQGLMLRFESKNTLRFAVTTLANLSEEPELKSCFHQELAADVLVCYLDVPDAPCKLSALETLARVSTEQDLDIICNAQGAISLLTDMVNRPSYKNYTLLENILYPATGLVKSLTMVSITAGIRRKTEGASSSLDKKVLEELIPKLREKLKVEVEKRDYTLEWGDIAVHPTRHSVQKWPKAEDGRIYVPYKVSVAFYDGDVKKIEEAALEFEKKTCVRFIPRSSQTDYIYIHAWDGNWSFLGYQGGHQAISLEPRKVTKGVVLHELMHALGFHHEHCRSDRDDHVWVLSHNVKPEWVDAIVKTTPHEHNLRTPYDYSSVTHYGMTAGSKDEHSPTLVPKDTSTMRRFGGGHTLSEGDVEKIEKMFGCEPAPRGPSDAASARTPGASAAYREADVSSHKMTLPRAPEKKGKEFIGCGVKESSLSRPVRHWPKSGDDHVYIPYKVSKDFYDYDVKTIEQAVEEFEKKTHMRFRPHGKETDFIHIQALEGSLSKSWSYVGRQGGSQDLSLEPGKVTKGTVLHELMHALGFHHEHCRSDRDDHVWVLSDNIKEEWKSQIVKMKSHAHDVSTPYDCSSIMHYSMTAGSVDERNPTIIPKNPLLMLHMGHGNSLSPCDVAKVQKLYGYETTLPLSSTGVGDRESLESQVRVWKRKTEQELKEEKEAKERELKTKAGPVGEIIRELRWLPKYDGSTVPRLEKLLDLLSSKCPAQEKESLHTAYRDEDGPKVLKKILEFPKAEADRISLLLVLNKIFNAVAVQTAEKVSKVPRTGDIAGDPLEKPKEWPKHRDGNVYIPYNISIAFNFWDKRTIQKAFSEFYSKTCIRFTPRKPEEENYINFQALDGSWSFLGKKGGAQSLSLEPGKVTKGTVLHELMHALGFQHEHCRSDRDKYIKINEDNVKEGEQRQFQLLETADSELPYDYISITHYGRFAFSGDGMSPTIIPIPETTTVGQRDCLSPLDVVKICKMYKTMEKGDIAKAVSETAVLSPTLKEPVPEMIAKAEAMKQGSGGCAIM